MAIMHKTTPIQQVLTSTIGTVNGPASEYGLAPHVVLAIVWDGSSRLIDVNGMCYGLPILSTALLAAILREGVDRAVSEIASRYAVPPKRVASDLDVFLAELLRQGLLTRRAQRGGGRGLWW